jgi:PAS domain-containing protein
MDRRASDTRSGGAITARGGDFLEPSARRVLTGDEGGDGVSAPRGVATSGAGSAWSEPTEGLEHVIDPAALVRLAERWARSAARPSTGAVAQRLATVLRRFAGVLRAEPFCPPAARDVGGWLVEAGWLTGLPDDPPDPERAADVLAAGLQLLRTEGPAVLGLPGPDGARRLHAALDELAAGFAAGLLEAVGPARAAADPRLSVFDHIPVGVAVLSLDGRVLAANPVLTTFLDLGHTLAEPRPFTDFVHADDLPEVAERYARLLRAEPDTQRMDTRLLRTDGVVV